jgi:hypothetical protein
VTPVPNKEPGKPETTREEPPREISKPIGDAIAAPVEPGMDQPLPEKGETLPTDDPSRDETIETPRVEPEIPNGEAISKPIGDAIPAPVEPGLDQPLPEKGVQPDEDDAAP